MQVRATHNEHRYRDIPVRDMYGLFDASATSEDIDEQQRERRVQHDLEQAVQDDEHGAVLPVSLRERVPHHDHRDAAREPDHDHARAVRREVGERGPCEPDHKERRDEPVEHEREEDVREHVEGREDRRERFVAHFGEDGPHHDDEPYRNR